MNNIYTQIFLASSYAVVVQSTSELSDSELEKISWLLTAEPVTEKQLTTSGSFIGPRAELISPWSTNAVEICKSVGVKSAKRLELFKISKSEKPSYDPMLQALYSTLSNNTLLITGEPQQTVVIRDLAKYNISEGLSLSDEEIAYLIDASEKLGRALTDCEVFSFAQINSEHCRHKIFNGTFYIDGVKQEKSLFRLIKDTSKESPENIVSAYSDNVAFISGPEISEFSLKNGENASEFSISKTNSVISIKAETHNFPTTVEPFYGASTGSGGEIRDRIAGGLGAIPLAGSAVYMTSLPQATEQQMGSLIRRKTVEVPNSSTNSRQSLRWSI